MKTFKQYLVEASQLKDFKSYVNRIPMLKAAINILKKLEKYGDVYIVGGAVRDIILGQDPKDIDIATNIPISKIEDLFKTFDIGNNKDFGIVVVKHQGFDFEVAQFRKDSYQTELQGKGANSVVIVSNFKDDASRRDLQINAMAIDSEGNIIDHFEGMKAIKDKVIKTVGDPEKRFSEDYLRMLRAIRFSSRLGFDIDEKTMQAIKKGSGNISKVAAERITQELVKMASQSGTKFADAIIKLDQSGLLEIILPEIVKQKDFFHSISDHPEGSKDGKEGTVFDHTIAALKANKLKDPIINLGVLLHDAGKINTYALDDKGKHTYHGHAKESMNIIDSIADRLKLDNKTRKALIFAAGNHMKMHDFFNMSNSKIMKLIQDDNWDVLYNVAMVDDKARKHLYDKNVWKNILKKVEELTLKYKDKKAQEELRKVVNGKIIMKLTGLKPSKELGNVINNTITWILDNNINPKDTKKIYKYIKEIL